MEMIQMENPILDLKNRNKNRGTKGKLGRGRPKGSLGKAPKFRNFIIKRWKPVYTEMVFMHLSGFTHQAIADKFEYSLVHVSNIISTDQSRALIDQVNSNLIKKKVESFGERVMKLQDKALGRVEAFMDSDHVFNNRPIEAVDRAMKILTLGKTSPLAEPEKESPNVVNNTNMLVVSNDQFDRIMKGGTLSANIPLYDPNKKIDSSINVSNEKISLTK